MASYQFINPLFKNITYHILSLPLAMRLKDERRNAACLFSFPHRVSICRLYTFIMGENAFFINAIVMLMAKVITMCLCWIFSIFIAPVGLAYLYYYHSRGD
ncbi:hypothetical protein SEES3845_012215 [Salmonella enterica subsp. enterica serovar Senftenberg str. ATCC 43845]|nr:hypothetical protein SEES3845_012215 [Salmonella enterica subsp. enterica serovar Senftenberg str. ATCC 43845]